MDLMQTRAVVFAKVAAMAGLDANVITDETTLEAVGLDSSDAVVLAMEVEQAVGFEVEVGLFLQCKTIADAAEAIAGLAA
jgi:acyl carrier protein